MFRDERTRRRAIRRLVALHGRLALFSQVDTHLHDVPVGSRTEAGRVSQRVVQAMRKRFKLDLQPADIRPVRDRSHMLWLVRYVLTQGPHHRIPGDPATDTGSCFLDLIGARVIEGLELVVNTVLPRLSKMDLCQMVGLPEVPQPATVEQIRRVGVVRLWDAACAALCVGPDAAGNSVPEVMARRAAVQIGRAAGFSWADLALALGRPPRTVHRLAAAVVPEAVLDAVRLRIDLELLAAERGRGG